MWKKVENKDLLFTTSSKENLIHWFSCFLLSYLLPTMFIIFWLWCVLYIHFRKWSEIRASDNKIVSPCLMRAAFFYKGILFSNNSKKKSKQRWVFVINTPYLWESFYKSSGTLYDCMLIWLESFILKCDLVCVLWIWKAVYYQQNYIKMLMTCNLNVTLSPLHWSKIFKINSQYQLLIINIQYIENNYTFN